MNGHKFFVSLAGAAPYYATPALLVGEGPWEARTLYLAIPRDAPGVEFRGEWDPLGMRATVSRDMLLKDVWVPADAEILPPGVFGLTLSTPAVSLPELLSNVPRFDAGRL